MMLVGHLPNIIGFQQPGIQSILDTALRASSPSIFLRGGRRRQALGRVTPVTSPGPNPIHEGSSTLPAKVPVTAPARALRAARFCPRSVSETELRPKREPVPAGERTTRSFGPLRCRRGYTNRTATALPVVPVPRLRTRYWPLNSDMYSHSSAHPPPGISLSASASCSIASSSVSP